MGINAGSLVGRPVVRLGAVAVVVLMVAAQLVVADGAAAQQQLDDGEITGLELSSDVVGELAISWQTPTPAPRDYRLMWACESLAFLSWRDANEAGRGNEYPAGDATSLTLTGLTAGETCKVKLRARYEPGNGRSTHWSGPWTEIATGTVAHQEEPVVQEQQDSQQQDDDEQQDVSLAGFDPGADHELVAGARIIAGREGRKADRGADRAWWATDTAAWHASGEISEGSLAWGDVTLNRVVYFPATDMLRFNSAPGVDLGDSFAVDGVNRELTVWVQTDGGTVSFAAKNHIASSGSNWIDFWAFAATAGVLDAVSDGDEIIVAITSTDEPPAPLPALTVTAHDVPDSHDGSPFTLELRFSEDIVNHDWTRRFDNIRVTRGQVTAFRRLQDNQRWEVTVKPFSDKTVAVSLPATTVCFVRHSRDSHNRGGLCTRDGRMLSDGLELTVDGPGGQPVELPADSPLRVTMELPSGCVMRDLDATGSTEFYRWHNGCLSKQRTDPQRSAEYFRFYMFEEGEVTLEAYSLTSYHLYLYTGSGELLAHSGIENEPNSEGGWLIRTLPRGAYVVEAATHWHHFDRGFSLEHRGTPLNPAIHGLSSLSLEGIDLTFDPTTYSYDVVAPYHLGETTLSLQKAFSTDAVGVSPGTASDDGYVVDLDGDSATITVTVTATQSINYFRPIGFANRFNPRYLTVDPPAAVATYTINVTRESIPADAARLRSLSVGDIDLGFDDHDHYYLADVDNSVATVTVEAAAYHSNAQVTVLPADSDSGTEGHQVSLAAGEINVITVTVVAPNMVALATYTVAVRRAGS